MSAAGGGRPEPIDVHLPAEPEDDEYFGPGEEEAERRLALHGLLLWLAGKVPDELITRGRELLAGYEEVQLVEAVAQTLKTRGLALPDGYLEVLAEFLDEAGADRAVLQGIQVSEDELSPPFVFQPGRPGGNPAELDELDQVLVELLAGDEQAVGVWRAWRLPADGTQSVPKRVYLIEFDDPDEVDLPEATQVIQDQLRAAGEENPQVEVYTTGVDLPGYHRLAVGSGRLIWPYAEGPAVRVAEAFDEADESGSRFREDHPRVDDPEERAKLLAYLDEGTTLLVTTARTDDVLDPARGPVVPLNFRTDGTWIWTDSTTYYLREHGLSPEPALVGHIRAADYVQYELDGVALHWAMATLTGSDERAVRTG